VRMPMVEVLEDVGYTVIDAHGLLCRFPSVKAVWRRQTKGDSALVWLDDRVH
jgi:hypothetical protein